MNNRIIGLAVVVLAVAGAIIFIVGARSNRDGSQLTANSTPPTSHPTTEHTIEARPASHVPAHYESAPPLKSLGATLPPERYTGKTRAAYEVARKIPQTLAQLPCYCHCDETIGHKSLHSCFEDEHAVGCAVCVDEALLAYKLQTEEKLTPEQVRQKIIEKYSAMQ